jgi:ABC-2 type transport system ATP-binding protein
MIHVTDLEKRHGDFQLRLSFDLPPGSVCGIIGRNGAGKSTLFKCILGLQRPDGGSVRTLGCDAGRLSPAEKARIGVAMSDSGFSSYLNVRDISKILGAFFGASFDADAFLARCADCGLPADKRLKEFSTGMLARLRVLVACSHNAKLLLLDEPTAGLDVVARTEILDMLRRYLAEDPERSLLISSHISGDLDRLCDRICLLHEGRILLEEDTDRILSDYAVLRLSPEGYERLDRQYLLHSKKEAFGWSCLTNEKRFYAENAPDAVLEPCSLDDLLLLLTEGGN